MGEAETDLSTWLTNWIRENQGVAGTVHELEGDVLHIRAHLNLPPPVVAATRQIPFGKGMAGLAWQRDHAVQTCNLKTDETGDVRPGAKAVNANAAVAIPVHAPDGKVRGVVGIAFMGEREIPDAEVARLTEQAEAAPF